MQGKRIACAGAAFLWLGMVGCNDSGTTPVDAGTHDSGPTLLGAGAVCAKNTDCFSMSCKTHCCGFSCSTDSACGVTSCDSTGACVYPSGIPCGTSTCTPSNSQVVTSTCMGGVCVPGAPRNCNDDFGCADASVCNTTCATAADCAAQGYCYDGGCYPMQTAGSPCLVDAGCLSGNCGSTAAGPALCCTGACLTANAICGALGCSGRGDCLYPSNLTPCSIKSCDAGYYTTPAQCDGNGSCPALTGVCTPYACGPNDACATSCSSTAGCIGGFCDVPSGKCCQNVTANTIYVDGTAGQTGQACCGRTAGAGACAYLADAVRIAADLKSSGTIVSVTSAPKDTSTVQLSYGLVVKAGGIQLPALKIARFTNDTSTSVTVEGAPGQAVQFANGFSTATQISVNDSMTLYLLNASFIGQNGQTGIQVNSGGSLKLGYDGASNSGGVTFDSANQFQGAGTAIACKGLASAPATIDDQLAAAVSSLKILNTNKHLVIGDYCTVNLKDNPIFGATPPICPPFQFDQRGLEVDGASSVTITNGTFQCFQNEAILMQNIGMGLPTVNGNFNLIRNSGTGVQCNAGTFSMAGTTITANHNGVIQSDDTTHGTTGTVNLSGGGNKVYCNTGGSPGADVLNLTASAGLNAKNVAWDLWDADAGATELWSCDSAYATCTCTGAASCSLQGTTPESGADTVTTNGTLVDDTGGSLVANPCQ